MLRFWSSSQKPAPSNWCHHESLNLVVPEMPAVQPGLLHLVRMQAGVRRQEYSVSQGLHSHSLCLHVASTLLSPTVHTASPWISDSITILYHRTVSPFFTLLPFLHFTLSPFSSLSTSHHHHHPFSLRLSTYTPPSSFARTPSLQYLCGSVWMSVMDLHTTSKKSQDNTHI